MARTSDLLSGTPTSKGASSRVRVAQEMARQELSDWSDQEFAQFVALGSPGYWLAYDAAAHARHARQIGHAEAMGETLSVATRVDPVRAVTEIAVYAQDRPLLFSRLAGGIAATGFTIADAKISPLSNGKVLDVFSVYDVNGNTGDVGDRQDRLTDMLNRSLAGTLTLSDVLSRRSTTLIGRTKVLPAPPRVLIDNDLSQTHNVIEVNGRDRPGLLYTLTATLNDIGVRVVSAKISTYGHRVVDVFYVTDHNGAKIVEGAWLHHIYVKLMDVLNRSDRPGRMSFGKSVATVGSLTLVSRVLGFIRDVMSAQILGAGIVADAAFVAFRLPNLFRRLFAEGAFSVAFVPLFSGTLEEEGQAAAAAFAEQAQAVMLLVLVPLTILAMIFMPGIMVVLAPGFRPGTERYDLAGHAVAHHLPVSCPDLAKRPAGRRAERAGQVLGLRRGADPVQPLFDPGVSADPLHADGRPLPCLGRGVGRRSAVPVDDARMPARGHPAAPAPSADDPDGETAIRVDGTCRARWGAQRS